MISKHINDKLVIELTDKVDTGNANRIEAELTEAVEAGGASEVTIDATNLDYISSAGLRVLLKLRKHLGSLTIEEANPDVYEIFEVTGFSQLMDVRKQTREISVEGL